MAIFHVVSVKNKKLAQPNPFFILSLYGREVPRPFFEWSDELLTLPFLSFFFLFRLGRIFQQKCGKAFSPYAPFSPILPVRRTLLIPSPSQGPKRRDGRLFLDLFPSFPHLPLTAQRLVSSCRRFFLSFFWQQECY